ARATFHQDIARAAGVELLQCFVDLGVLLESQTVEIGGILANISEATPADDNSPRLVFALRAIWKTCRQRRVIGQRCASTDNDGIAVCAVFVNVLPRHLPSNPLAGAISSRSKAIDGLRKF